MPLIEVTQSRYVTATIRLDAGTATLIDQYAAFVHGSADDVVDKALNYVFAKDREFQDYLKSSQAGKVAPSLRVRKGGSADATETTANGRASSLGVEASREPVPKVQSVPEETHAVLRTG
jgi:hypothetical protein